MTAAEALSRIPIVIGAFDLVAFDARRRALPLQSLILSTSLRAISRYGAIVRLRPIMFRVVAALAGGAALSMPELIDVVYGDDPDGGPETAAKCIEVIIFIERPKIEICGLSLVRPRRAHLQLKVDCAA